jgi:hypothetical protein
MDIGPAARLVVAASAKDQFWIFEIENEPMIDTGVVREPHGGGLALAMKRRARLAFSMTPTRRPFPRCVAATEAAGAFFGVEDAG